MTTSTVRRLYLYIAAFIGLQLLIAGGRLLLTVLLQYAFLTGTIADIDALANLVSTSLAMFVVGFGLWLLHWFIAQRGTRRDEDQRSTLRRLYLYAVLLVSALVMLFNTQTILDHAFATGTDRFNGDELTLALGTLVVNAMVYAFHWFVAAVDRREVEAHGGTATLRRWYLVIVLAFSLAMAAWAAADLLHQIIRAAVDPAVAGVSGTSSAIASLVAGLVFWFPHYLWGQRLLRAPGPLQSSEARSTLRQVYGALVIVVSAITALGACGIFVQEAILALLGNGTWESVFSDHLLAIATFVVSLAVWRFHHHLLPDEARATGTAASVATSHRMITYLMAAVGLGALYFGLGGLVSILLRVALQSSAVISTLHEQLAFYIALAIVALPVYSLAARRGERLARSSAVEERTLARRIYLYAALLFGIVATIVAIVQLVRLLLGAAFGISEAEWLADVGGWVGYAVIGIVIGLYHLSLVRRAAAAQEQIAPLAVALVVDDGLRAAVSALVRRELPAVDLRVAAPNDLAAITDALAGADVLVTSLTVLWEHREAQTLNRFAGTKLLLPTSVPRYDVLGAGRGDDAFAHETLRALRAYATANDNNQREEETTPREPAPGDTDMPAGATAAE